MYSYRWDVHKQNHMNWWIARFKTVFWPEFHPCFVSCPKETLQARAHHEAWPPAAGRIKMWWPNDTFQTDDLVDHLGDINTAHDSKQSVEKKFDAMGFLKKKQVHCYTKKHVVSSFMPCFFLDCKDIESWCEMLMLGEIIG